MAIFDELRGLLWPGEFVVEYEDSRRERLLSGEGVLLTPPADDPRGYGALTADLPKKHPRNQKQCGRQVEFTELRAVYSLDGRKLWPPDDRARRIG